VTSVLLYRLHTFVPQTSLMQLSKYTASGSHSV
jgi:hypothetical protein